LPAITFGTVVKLLIWSLIVGAILAFFNISPQDIFAYVTGAASELVHNFERYAGRALTYILLGAVVVVPIWAIFVLPGKFRRRG
jgi:hypothetical protein